MTNILYSQNDGYFSLFIYVFHSFLPQPKLRITVKRFILADVDPSRSGDVQELTNYL